MISFNTIVYPFALICFLTLFHITVWRSFRVKKQIFFIFFLFLGLPLLAEVLAFLMKPEWFFSFENSAMFVLYLSLAVMYLQMFPGAQARSPSALIMLLPDIRQKGLEKSSILEALKNESMLEDRLDDLVNDGFAVKTEQGFKLRLPGLVLAWFFYTYRLVLGLPQGKG